jgi:F-type H+-transporting ATPase subunit delta
MLENDAARAYAQALFELADRDGKLDIFSEQLESIADVFNTQSELRQLMFHPQVKAEVKKDTLRQIFGTDTDQMVMNFLWLLVDRRRITGINTIWRQYRTLVNEARNLEEAEVTTAAPLGNAAQKTLQEKLSALTGKNIVLHTKIDPQIIGGVIVRMGDKLIDGSVARQLSDLRCTLSSVKRNRLG